MPKFSHIFSIGIVALSQGELAWASSAEEAARLQARAMDLRYRIHKNAGGKPLSPSMQKRDKELSEVSQKVAQGGFVAESRKAQERMEKTNEVKIRQLKAELKTEEIKAELEAKDPDHKMRDKIRADIKAGKILSETSAAPDLGVSGKPASGTPAPVSKANSDTGTSHPETVLDGSDVPREIEFFPQEKPQSHEHKTGPEAIHTPRPK